jgi:hypothetical protein
VHGAIRRRSIDRSGSRQLAVRIHVGTCTNHALVEDFAEKLRAHRAARPAHASDILDKRCGKPLRQEGALWRQQCAVERAVGGGGRSHLRDSEADKELVNTIAIAVLSDGQYAQRAATRANNVGRLDSSRLGQTRGDVAIDAKRVATTSLVDNEQTVDIGVHLHLKNARTKAGHLGLRAQKSRRAKHCTRREKRRVSGTNDIVRVDGTRSREPDIERVVDGAAAQIGCDQLQSGGPCGRREHQRSVGARRFGIECEICTLSRFEKQTVDGHGRRERGGERGAGVVDAHRANANAGARGGARVKKLHRKNGKLVNAVAVGIADVDDAERLLDHARPHHVDVDGADGQELDVVRTQHERANVQFGLTRGTTRRLARRAVAQRERHQQRHGAVAIYIQYCEIEFARFNVAPRPCRRLRVERAHVAAGARACSVLVQLLRIEHAFGKRKQQ